MDSNKESKAETSQSENQKGADVLGSLITLAVGVVAVGAGLVWAGKKVKEYVENSESTSRRDEYSNGLREFYVQTDVKIEYVSDFIIATKANRNAARLELGNIRYDIYQSEYDRTKFILHEIYKLPNGEMEHRATPHYQRWRQDVEIMMAKPRARQNSGIPYGYKLIT